MLHSFLVVPTSFHGVRAQAHIPNFSIGLDLGFSGWFQSSCAILWICWFMWAGSRRRCVLRCKTKKKYLSIFGSVGTPHPAPLHSLMAQGRPFSFPLLFLADECVWCCPCSPAFPSVAFQGFVLITEVLYSWWCSNLSLCAKACIRIRNWMLSWCKLISLH